VPIWSEGFSIDEIAAFWESNVKAALDAGFPFMRLGGSELVDAGWETPFSGIFRLVISDMYRYPDAGDRVTSSFIKQHEPYPGYWASSEERALRQVGTQLSATLGSRDRVRALDAGCGEGRLLRWIARFASKITAVDPDSERLNAARKRAAELPAGTEATFRQSPITDLSGGPFELVVCSHVIQHVPTTELVPILRRFHEITADGAALVLSFSRAPVGQGGYSLDRLERGEVRSQRVDRRQFNQACTARNACETLPVRHVDPEELAAEAAGAGWLASWDWTYHVLDDLGVVDEHADRDELTNDSPPLRRYLGRDIVTLWHREG
jgi:SAM-dependent methyltransferase